MGKFSFYIEGVKVAEANNVITDQGKIVIGSYLSETRSSWADSLAVGAGQSAPSATNSTLDLEFWREIIDLKTYSVENNQLIVRGTIPASVVGKIYEVGVYSTTSPTAVSSSGPVICYFDKAVEDWSEGASDSVSVRVGSSSLMVTSQGPEKPSSLRFFGDLRSFNQDSVFSLGYTGSGSPSSVSVRIKSDSANFREYTFTPNSSGAYSIEKWSFSDFSIVGGAAISEFFDVEVAVVGAGHIVFDVLSVVDQQTGGLSDALVSRAIINQQGLDFIKKLPSRELQIEYAIDLGSGGS